RGAAGAARRPGRRGPRDPGGKRPRGLRSAVMRRIVALFALGASLAVGAPLHGDGGTPTYADVAPILDPKSPRLHSAGGIAPAPPSGLAIAPRAAYPPHAAVRGIDDYHCTLLTTKLAADSMVTSARVIPGRPEIVHHVILFEETGAAAAAARAKDKASGGKGW